MNQEQKADRKLAVIFWGIVTAILMLGIGVGGLLNAQGNYIYFAFKICALPSILMFGFCLFVHLRNKREKK